jgi:hypothetical protein
MEKYKIELAKRNGTALNLYPALVSEKVGRRYTINDEIAILRQRDTKPEEYEEYNYYVEQCKSEAKQELGIDA